MYPPLHQRVVDASGHVTPIWLDWLRQLVVEAGTGGAPTTGPYVLAGAEAALTAARILTAGAGITITDGGAGGALTVAALAIPGTFGVTVDGGGSAISTGIKGYLQVPYAHTITVGTLLADQSGSAVVDVWRDTYANAPPTNADSITAAAPLTLSAAMKSTDSTLTGWSLSGAAGDVYGFNVDSAATLTRLTCQLTVVRT